MKKNREVVNTGCCKRNVRIVEILDGAKAAVSSELDGIFTLKGVQETALKAFLNGKDVFA